MGNNQNQIIKQALEILSENNRFALKSITNDSAIKTNFYKLSADPELDTETTKDLEEMEKSKTDLEKRFNLDMRENHEIKEPEPEPEPEDELEDESSKKRQT